MTSRNSFYHRVERFLSSRPFKFGIRVISIATLAWCIGYYAFVIRPRQSELRNYLKGTDKVYLVPERNTSLPSTSVPDTDALPQVRQGINVEDTDKSASHSNPKWEWEGYNTTDDVSDSNHLIVDELDTHNQPSIGHSDSDAHNKEITHDSDALLEEAYANLYLAKDTLDQFLPAIVDQLNALSPEEQRQSLAEAKQLMMNQVSPEAKKILDKYPELVDKGWEFFLDKLLDYGYELPD